MLLLLYKWKISGKPFVTKLEQTFREIHSQTIHNLHGDELNVTRTLKAQKYMFFFEQLELDLRHKSS